MKALATSYIAAALFFVGPVSLAQTEAPKPDSKQEAPSKERETEFIPLPTPPGQSDPQQELKQLFAEVELRLREIDLLLSDAGAGDAPLDDVGESGIMKLLDESQAASRKAIDDIDRILEIASQMGSPSSGSGDPSQSGQPQSQPEGESPLDQQSGEQNRQRESTPQTPGQEQQSEQPGGQEKQPGTPEGSQESDQESQQEQGDMPPGQKPGDPSSSSPTGQEWGDLPVRVREVFRSEGGGDLPVQYRDWIDAYHRRLNRRRR